VIVDESRGGVGVQTGEVEGVSRELATVAFHEEGVVVFG